MSLKETVEETRLFLRSLYDPDAVDEWNKRFEKTNPNRKYEEKPVETTYKISPHLIQIRRMYLRDDGIDKTTRQISEYNRKIAKGNKKSIDGHKFEPDVGYHKDSLTEEERTEYNHLRDELKDFLKVEKFLKKQLESDERDLICSEPNEIILKYLNAKEKLGSGEELETTAFLTSKKNIDLRHEVESQSYEKKK